MYIRLAVYCILMFCSVMTRPTVAVWALLNPFFVSFLQGANHPVRCVVVWINFTPLNIDLSRPVNSQLDGPGAAHFRSYKQINYRFFLLLQLNIKSMNSKDTYDCHCPGNPTVSAKLFECHITVQIGVQIEHQLTTVIIHWHIWTGVFFRCSHISVTKKGRERERGCEDRDSFTHTQEKRQKETIQVGPSFCHSELCELNMK